MKLYLAKELGIIVLALLMIGTAFSASRTEVKAQGEPVMRIVNSVTGSANINAGSLDQPFPAQGFPFTVNVTLSVPAPVVNFMAFQVGILYNKTLTNCTAAWLGNTYRSFIFYGKNPITCTPLFTIEEDLSYVYWGASLLIPGTLPAGEYLLGQANFTASRAGTSLLKIILAGDIPPAYVGDSFLLDDLYHNIPFLSENCEVTATGALSPPQALFSFNSTARIYTDPPMVSNLIAGKKLNVSLYMAGASEVTTWTANILYNNTLLMATDAYEGAFLQSAGSTTFTSTIDHESGSVQLSCLLLTSGGANDTGKRLAIITFEVLGLGVSQIIVERADIKPLIVTFDASASFDPNPDGTIVAYQWDFGDNTTAEGLNVMHAYSLSGSYLVTLTVFDNNGLNGSSSQIVKIGAAPFVTFTFSPAEPLNIDTVTFNASLSYDPDGTIVSYIWNFGDETNETETNETVITHQYIVRGVYIANLTVTDNEGLSNSSTVTILVGRRPVPDFYPDPDRRPTQEELDTLEVNGSYGPYERGPYGIYGQNETVGFDASASKVGEEGAIDTYIALYVWYFGDYSDPVIVNASDSSTFNGSQAYSASHTFGIGGGFNVNLTIYDNWGISASIAKGIETSGEAKPLESTSRTLYFAVAGAVFAMVVVGAIIVKKRQKPESARKERYRVI